MVSYSFKERFADPVRCGLGIIKPNPDRGLFPKRQTVRAVGKKRHARPGELVQLYTGLRTKNARLIGTAVCSRTAPIIIDFVWHTSRREDIHLGVLIDGTLLMEKEALDFVRSDGFRTIQDFIDFWGENHGIDKLFEGIIIYWERKK